MFNGGNPIRITKKNFIIGGNNSPYDVKFSLDAKKVAILNAKKNSITIRDVNTNTSLCGCLKLKKPINKFCWGPYDISIAIITDNIITIWAIYENKTHKLNVQIDALTSVCWFNKKNAIAVVTSSEKIKVLDLSSGQFKELPINLKKPINSICFAPEDDYFAAAVNNDIIIWKIDSGIVKGSYVLKGHTAPVQRVYYNASGDLLASYDSNNLVIVWDLNKTPQILYTLNKKNSFSIKNICWDRKNENNEEKIIIFAEEKRKPTLFFYTLPCKKSGFDPKKALFEQLPSLFAAKNINITNYKRGEIEKCIHDKIKEASHLLDTIWKWYESNKDQCNNNYRFNITRVTFCFGTIVKGFCTKIVKKIDMEKFNKTNGLGWKRKKLKSHILELKEIKHYRALYRTGMQKNLCDKTIDLFKTFFKKYSNSEYCEDLLNLTRIAYLILLSKDERCNILKIESADFLRRNYLDNDIIVLNLHHWERGDNECNSFKIGKTKICSESRLQKCFDCFYLRHGLARLLFDPKSPGNYQLDTELLTRFAKAQKVINKAWGTGRLTTNAIMILRSKYGFGSSINDGF